MHNHRKIRVAFFADILTRDYDGAIKTMYHLIDNIPEEKFEFMFCSGMPPKEKMNHRIVEIPSFVLPFNSNYKASLPYFSNKLTKELTDFNPDVIHIATPSPLGFFGLYYAKRNHIPTLSIYHTNFLSYMKHYFKSLPFLIKPVETIVKYAYRSFYNFCKTVYVPTLQMIRELKECGVAENNLKLWQRGIAVDIFNPSKKDKNFIRQLTGNDKPNILFASRLVWEKNLETLFRIYDEIEAQHLDVNFVIAGTGVAETEARKKMKNAVFLGQLDQETLSKVYATSDVFVFPSVSETFGNVVVEAMACGCVPVIARGGGSRNLVRDGETGFLCDPYDAASYVQKIKVLLNNTFVRESMQSNGVKFASTLNWDHLVNEYFTDLETLATHHYSSYTNEAILPNEIYPTNFAV
ncbi:MAG TPA: glycosyltransferase family 1 protein [Dysgonamonadaceae bacterium]|nr:glycosyltransferase family 1 protein [Dysgonamonadaceae bacterium]HOT64225.1 glycosyltransferase family 1 protein [Dysgonamonadaceae bacterium]HPD43222.1 glycosyltransferase family 1 protein [Dysgonamonadaceae bacterium]HQG08923.1 glycosyltransferase family 1 protein [Dysgonamonadaceae bacterium]HRU13457.1 glycosyltransferase family 1 protein [Dysgonamonadaceae bacterium]